MRKVLIYIVSIFILLIPMYFIFIWSPKDEKNIDQSIEADVEVVNNEDALLLDDINVDDTIEKSIFKVDRKRIKAELLNKYKVIITNITEKLSVVDLNYIEEQEMQEDYEKSTKEIINFLKRRLSEADYDKVKNILIPYINFDMI